MKRLICLLTACLFLAAFLDEASAKRFGGGRSFGSRPSYSRPAPKPSPSSQQSMTQQQPGQTRPGGFFSRPGLGGMLGGMLMGGLIGSMLFGRGFGGGIGLLEILLIGGGLFLLFRMMRARRGLEPAPQAVGGPQAGTSGWGNDWDRLRGDGEPQARTGDVSGPVPDGFDAKEFLDGAKTLYNRMQRSWSERDLTDIDSFVTPGMMAEVRRQAEEDTDRNRTEVLLVNARILEVRTEGQEQTASVYFDVLLREDPSQSQPTQTREVWHFVRNPNKAGDSWRLDGIQQLEQ